MTAGLLRTPLRLAARRYPLYSGGASLMQREPLRRLTPPQPVAEATLRDGGRLYVRSHDFIGRAILLTGDYDPKLTWLCRRLLRPGDTVLDVGANHGVISAYAARLVGPSGRVHAFEPQADLADLMRRSMRANGYDHVTVHTIALSDADASAPLFGSAASSATASLEPDAGPAGLGTVTVRHAGSVLHELGLGPVRLLKLDIEGHEERFLAGARDFLKANPPEAIAFESHGDDLFSARPVVRALSELGYELYQVPKALLRMRLVPITGDEVGRGFDFVALRPADAGRPRILSTVGEGTWPDAETITLGSSRRSRLRGLSAMARRARDHDLVVLNGAVSFAHLYDEILLAGWLARRSPGLCVVLEGCYWEEGTRVLDRIAWRFSGRPTGHDPPARRGRMLSRSLVRWVNRPSVHYIVFGSDEREVFAQRWSIPVERVAALTYHCHRWAESSDPVPSTAAPLVFAGGDSLRDYRPLVAAAGQLSARVIIATRLPLADLPEGVRAGPLSEESFQAMAAAAGVHVVPMIARPPRSAGQASYLDAMMLGAAVVVTEGLGVRDHVVHEHEGLIVPPDDPGALAAAIQRCLETPTLRATLGRAGRERARREFTLEAFRARQYAELVRIWHTHQGLPDRGGPG